MLASIFLVSPIFYLENHTPENAVKRPEKTVPSTRFMSLFEKEFKSHHRLSKGYIVHQQRKFVLTYNGRQMFRVIKSFPSSLYLSL